MRKFRCYQCDSHQYCEVVIPGPKEGIPAPVGCPYMKSDLDKSRFEEVIE